MCVGRGGGARGGGCGRGSQGVRRRSIYHSDPAVIDAVVVSASAGRRDEVSDATQPRQRQNQCLRMSAARPQNRGIDGASIGVDCNALYSAFSCGYRPPWGRVIAGDL